jgi:hypothetical protein
MYKHPWTDILYSKELYPICREHIGLLISENVQEIYFVCPEVKIVKLFDFGG